MSTLRLYCIFLLLFIKLSGYSQIYTPSQNSFIKFENGGLDVADLDNDHDLDIIITGLSTAGIAKTIAYRNDNGSFVEMPTNLPNLQNSDVACGDYNNDGLYDIAISGFDLSGNYTLLYENQGNFIFTESVGNSFLGLFNSTISWIDYDADNDLDFLLTGTNGQMEEFSILYENLDGNSFSASSSFSADGLAQASVDWTDIDNDGDLDFAAVGLTANESENFVGIFVNNGNKTFTNTNSNFPKLMNGTIDFGDFDNDSDQDVILTGNYGSSTHFSKIYLNNYGEFTELEVALEGVAQNFRSGSGFIDFDHDGDLDIFLSGRTGGLFGNGFFELLENKNESLITVSSVGIPDLGAREVYPGDYDNDGDLDLLILHDGYSGTEKMLYQNNTLTASYSTNSKPTPPLVLYRSVKGNENLLTWDNGDDDLTTIEALTYNFYAGTKTLTDDMVPAHSDISTGKRKLPQKGNSRLPRTKLETDYEGFIYWGVQSIDGSYIGSDFSQEQHFYNILAPSSLDGLIETEPVSIHLSWKDNSNIETKYNIKRSIDSQDYQLINEGPADLVAYHDQSANQLEVLYSYQVSVENSLGESGYDSISVAIPAPPESFSLDKYSRSEDNINLLWRDVSNYETGYSIERSFMDLNSFSQIHVNDKNSGAFSDSFQSLEGHYYYRACAINSFGHGPFSDTVHFINILPPSDLLGVATGSPLTMQLSWKDNSNVEEVYEIYRSAEGGQKNKLMTLSANSTQYTDTESLTFETKYKYFVNSRLGDFPSIFDSIALVVPAPPENLTAKDSIGRVFLEWKDQSNFENEFIIECSEGNAENFQEIIRVTENTEQYLDTRELNKGDLYFRLKAITADGIGVYSDTVFFSFLSTPSFSGAVITRDSLFIEILWEDLTDYESQYKVTRIDQETSISNFIDLPQNTVNYKDVSVEIEKAYFYLLQAFNDFATSKSDSILVVIPKAPEILEPSISRNKIVVQWKDNSEFEDNYKIERAKDDLIFETISEEERNVEVFEDIKIVDGTAYHYKVIPTNRYGEGFSSDTVTIYYLDAPLDSGSVVDLENSTVEIKWQDISSHEAGYIIERKLINEKAYVVVDTVPANSESYLDNQILETGTYSYRVTAYFNNARSESLEFVVNLVTSLRAEIRGEVRFFPNPVSSTFHIDIPKVFNDNHSVFLHSVSGTMIPEGLYRIYHTENGLLIDIEHLKSGPYVLILKMGKVNHNIKLIKD